SKAFLAAEILVKILSRVSPAHRIRVVSSAVEHCLHTAGVTGSNPVPPTKRRRNQALSGNARCLICFWCSKSVPRGVQVDHSTTRSGAGGRSPGAPSAYF